MEKINIPGGGIAWIKTERELQEEIDQHEETAALGKALSKLLKANDPDKSAIESIVSKHEQRKAEKEAKKAAKSKP